MPLNANALIGLAKAKSFLTITGATDDYKIEDAINAASTLAEGYCLRPLKKATYTSVRLEGVCNMKLYPWGLEPRLGYPIDVSGAVTVVVDNVAQTVWKTEADGDPGLKDVIVRSDYLYRRAGWDACHSGHPYNIVLTYSGGYDPVPNDLQDACGFIIQRNWAMDQQKQLTNIAMLTPPNAVGGSVQFQPRGYVLPGPAKDILDLYRVMIRA